MGEMECLSFFPPRKGIHLQYRLTNEETNIVLYPLKNMKTTALSPNKVQAI